MNLQTYQQLASVTDAQMSNKPLNWLWKWFYKTEFTLNRILCTIHMVLGMMSELVELRKAFKSGDKVNILEELGDFMWYASGYCTHNQIDLHRAFNIYTLTFKKRYETNYILLDLTDQVSELANVWKRQLAYKKEPSIVQIEMIAIVLMEFRLLILRSGFTIEQICERNIAKLEARYQGKFSEFKALNRNLETEFLVLKN